MNRLKAENIELKIGIADKLSKTVGTLHTKFI